MIRAEEPTPTPTPAPTPSGTPTPPAPELVEACGTSAATPCHVYVSDDVLPFVGAYCVLVVLLLAAILGAQLRRP